MENIIIQKDVPIAIVQLNRPKALNALSPALMKELAQALQELDADSETHVIVLTGNEKAFAAGADIKEMAPLTTQQIEDRDPLAIWDRIYKIRKPLIAAVSGYALGGGCELAMMCDIIVAAESAKFGQPEINLGIIPGAGGTQRLPKTIGKFKAMEWILTGDIYSAKEAYAAGLVSRVVPDGKHLEEAKKLAQKIASKSLCALTKAKEAILYSLEYPLEEALQKERKLFYQLFDTEDQKEGMQAFLEKRKPNFKGK